MPTTKQSNERLAYSVEEFMALACYSRNKVYSAIADGRLQTFKDGKRRLISARAAHDFIEAQERATGGAK